MYGLTATNSHDNFQFVAILQHVLLELTSRHNLAVAFDGNAFAAQLHVFDQLGHADLLFKHLGSTVDKDCDHNGLG